MKHNCLTKKNKRSGCEYGFCYERLASKYRFGSANCTCLVIRSNVHRPRLVLPYNQAISPSLTRFGHYIHVKVDVLKLQFQSRFLGRGHCHSQPNKDLEVYEMN